MLAYFSGLLWAINNYVLTNNGAITAIATVVIAVFTCVLAFVSHRQARLAQDAVNAARKSAEVAEQALVAGQRAFISVSFRHSANKDIKTGEVTHWTFTPIWRNNGDTPTRRMENHVNILLFEEEPKDWDFPDLWHSQIPPGKRVPVPLGVGPKGSIEGEALSIPVSEMQDVIDEKRILYFWGWTTYSDVFPNTARHVTRFAVQIVVGGDPLSTDRISFGYKFLRRYNCSDEECEYQGYSANWTPPEVTRG